MDNTQAQLILSNYRPNGSDEGDPDFAEALELASQDKDLRQWLSEERTQDEVFANALTEIAIPEQLREEIFNVITSETSEDSILPLDEFDNQFATAFKDLAAPASLRDDILEAMNKQQKVTPLPTRERTPQKARRFQWPTMPSIGFAAAAGVAIALFWTIKGPVNTDFTASNGITSSAVEENAVNIISRTMFLDLTDEKQNKLFNFLSEADTPSPNILPVGLREYNGVGCKKLSFNGKPASLICFQKDKDSPVVHLVLLNREDMDEELPNFEQAADNCFDSKEKGWSIARWQDEEHAAILLGKMAPEELSKIF